MPRPRSLVRRARLAEGLAVVLALGSFAACTGERPTLADAAETTTTEATATTEPEPAGAEVAQAKDPTIDVYATEDADAPDRQIASGIDTSTNDNPVVFLVKDREEDAERIEVHLPVEPSGSTGWVEASEVTLSAVAFRIEVITADHRLRVLRDDEVIVDEPISIGTEDAPEPGGTYYLKELVEPPEPDTVYGAYAYGLSGFENVVVGFDDEDVVGIHGTNDPEGLGDDVSTGSVGLEDEVIVRMVEEIGLPLGTPVEVRS